MWANPPSSTPSQARPVPRLALPPYELLEAIGRKRGLLVRGGEVNTERCAIMLVDEFRACKWGRISLERPPQRDDMADFAEEDEE